MGDERSVAIVEVAWAAKTTKQKHLFVAGELIGKVTDVHEPKWAMSDRWRLLKELGGVINDAEPLVCGRRIEWEDHR